MLWLLTACSHLEPWPDPSAHEEVERIAVSPGTLDFGTISATIQRQASAQLTIYNLGTSAVTVTGQDEPIGDEGVFLVDALPVLSVEAGASKQFDVSFIPGTQGNFLARLRFDPGSEVVELVGAATAPVLEVTAQDIPATVLGCSGIGTVTVHNAGSEPLTLDASVTGDDFEVTGWPPEVPPGEEGTVEVQFTPGGGGDRGGVLLLASNDPQTPETAVTLEALGYEGERVRQRFIYAPALPTDVILAVESEDYADDARLGAALEAYAERLVDTHLDVHVLALGSASACPATGPRWTDTDASSLTLQYVLGQGFAAAGGAWDRDLLGLVERALYEAEPGGCIDGFRRDSAALDIIVVAADDPTGDAVASVESLASTLADGTSLRFSGLLPRSVECGDPTTSYYDAALAWNGAVGDLCDTSWTPAFSAFAALPVAGVEARYPLSETPVPGSVVVTADGATFTDWNFEADSNEIVIPAGLGPTIGAELEFDYVSAVSCAE